MVKRRTSSLIGAGILTVTASFTGAGGAEPPPDRAVVEHHAGEAFRRLDGQSQAVHEAPGSRPPNSIQAPAPVSSDQAIDQSQPGPGLLVGHGQGDLSKGKLVCQRVSELAARADLAKQIRVQIKEHATDRIRERTGREPEQDIEVVREELVQEFLQGVKIIDRRLDEAHNTCSATAVMPTQSSVAAPLGPSNPVMNPPR